MKIKYIHIKNFKSFGEQIINLENLTILLGANASGKSNTVSIIRFVNNIILYGLDDAISLLGGINYAINATIGKNESMYLKFMRLLISLESLMQVVMSPTISVT